MLPPIASERGAVDMHVEGVTGADRTARAIQMLIAGAGERDNRRQKGS